MERIVLVEGDVIEETLSRGGQSSLKNLLKVKRVGPDHRGQDSVHMVYAVDESGVPVDVIYGLEKEEIDGDRAIIPSVFTTLGGVLRHALKRTEAPEGTKWSYEPEE